MSANQAHDIVEVLKRNKEISSKEIFESLPKPTSYATVKRTLAQLIDQNLITKSGKGKSTRYSISLAYALLYPVDLDDYFQQEIDDRQIKSHFNFDLITNTLNSCNLFTTPETERLEILHQIFKNKIAQLSASAYNKEMERLAIDLSWKSSQIEGNTYSLLETERLLKESETASGKTKEEAIMLLNHKEAIDFIVEHTDYLNPLSVAKIEDIHRILIDQLGIEKNLRRSRIGISGTNYRPLDNEFQILEALRNMCDLVNKKENVFEKALLILFLISYIQPFVDGNKRTARIMSNAILMSHGYCPISFRTVDSVQYKMAMLVFYEQNNISCFKDIFIDQFEFAVQTYF